jgi:hypothetical protein
MKNTLKFASVFLLVTLSLISCSKDDDGPSTSGNIVGKWEFFKEGEIINGNEILTNYEHQAGCTKDNTEFNTDGSFVDSYYYEECESEISMGTYTKSGNTLTRNDGFDDFSYTIVELNSTTLKVKETYNDEGETITSVTVFKRVN